MVKKFSLKKHVYITINNCDGFSKADTSSHGSKGVGREEFAIRWKRGDKKENQGETSFKLVDKASLEVNWGETFSIKQCTFFYNAESDDPGCNKNYLEKLIEFSLVRRLALTDGENEEDSKKKRAKGTLEFAVAKFNLATLFAGNIKRAQTKMIELVSLQSKKKENILSVEIKITDPNDEEEEEEEKPKEKAEKIALEEPKGTPSKKKREETKEERRERRLSKKVDVTVAEEPKALKKKKKKKRDGDDDDDEEEEEEGGEVIMMEKPKTPKKKKKDADNEENDEIIMEEKPKTPKKKRRDTIGASAAAAAAEEEEIIIIEEKPKAGKKKKRGADSEEHQLTPPPPPGISLSAQLETPGKKKKKNKDDDNDAKDAKTAALEQEIARLKSLNTSLKQENRSLRSSPAPTPTPSKASSLLSASMPPYSPSPVSHDGDSSSSSKKAKKKGDHDDNNGGGGGVEFKKYQREIRTLHEENTRYTFEFDVMKSIFETASELTFTSQDVPLAAVKINEALGAAHAYEHPSEPECYRGILDKLPMAYNVKSDGYIYSFYWVRTLYSVLKAAAVELDRPLLRTPEAEAEFLVEPIDLDDGDDGDDLIVALLAQLYDAYVVALSRVYVALDTATVKGILEAKAENNPNGTRSVLAVINSVVKAAREARLPSAIVKQTMDQAFWCINGTLFNELVNRPEYCTCGMALHIKEALSELERFISRDRSLAFAKKRLMLVKDTANLFMMDKKLLTDDEVFSTAIPSLNMSQVLKLLDNFTPDSFMDSKVDSSIMQLTRSRVNTRGSQQIKVDPHAFVQTLK